MNAGLIKHYPEYELRIEGSFDLPAPATNFFVGATVKVAAGRTPTSSSSIIDSVLVRIDMLRRDDFIATGDFLTYQLNIPGVYVHAEEYLVNVTSAYSVLAFQDLKLYWFGDHYQVHWANFDWYHDGTLFYSHGPGSLGDPSDWQAKSAVPLFGIQPYIECLPAADRNPLYPTPPPVGEPPFDVYADSSATGGWRFKLPGSGWQTPPVKLVVVAPLDSDCAVGNPSYAEPTATNTYNGTTSGYYRSTYNGTSIAYQSRSCPVWLVENLPTAIVKLGDDYRTMQYRGGMPGVDHSTSWSCSREGIDDVRGDQQFVEQFPMQSELLSVVGNSAHPIEDTLGYELCAPYRIEAAQSVSPFGGYIKVTSTRQSVFPARTRFDGSQIDYYRPSAPQTEIAAYLNYWGNRHAQYVYWFPSDSGLGFQWVADGSDAAPFYYWSWLGEQHLTHPALPSLEDRKTRNCMPSAALYQGLYGHSEFVKNYIFPNAYTSFVGVSNFHVREASIPNNRKLTSASSGAWTFTDCTAVFGATDITLTRIGAATEYEVDYDASNFDSLPLFYAAICQRLTIDFDPTNLDALDVFLVDSQGNEAPFCDLSDGAPFTKTFLGKTGSYYAGSWAQDYGALFTTDIGTDSLPEGKSLDHMTDERFVEAFQMWRARGFDILRFKVTPTDPTMVVKLKYPTFIKNVPITGGQADKWCPESSSQASWLRVNGTGTRIGSWNWYSGGMLATPGILAAHIKPSVVNTLGTVMAMFEAADPVTGVPAEIPTLYDSIEGDTELDASIDTFGFWLPLPDRPPTFALVNTYQMPPMSGWPGYDRDPATLQENSDLAYKTYSYSFERRLYAAAGSGAVHLFDGLDQVTTVLGSYQPGFTVSGHARAVTGYESQCSVQYGGQEIAEASLNHGYFIEPGAAASSPTGGIWNWAHPLGRYHEVWEEDGNVFHGWCDRAVPYFGLDGSSQVTSGGTDSWPKGTCDKRDGDLIIVFTREDPPGTFTSMLTTTRNDGGSYTTPTTLLTDTWFPVPVTNALGGILFVGLRYDSGTSGPGVLIGCYQEPFENSPGADFTLVDELGADIRVEGTGFGFLEPWDAGIAYVLVATPEGTSSQERFVCKDATGGSWKQL